MSNRNIERSERGVPTCTRDECPQYDGKRCREMGFRPESICEPQVIDDASDARIGRIVRESGFNADDAKAVHTIYGWAGNGASRIVDCMRELAKALRTDKRSTSLATDRGGEE